MIYGSTVVMSVYYNIISIIYLMITDITKSYC